ncbi:MAG: hypothetical protein ACYS8Z_15695 [Planctomycetota bacterium]|jgi:hypothetical protein
MPAPYKRLIHHDWQGLERIINDLYRILNQDTTLSDMVSDITVGDSQLKIVSDALSDTESEQVVVSDAVSNCESEQKVISDEILTVSDALSDLVSDMIIAQSDIIALETWEKITANGVTLGDGPPTSGDAVADLQTAHDSNTYTVNEIAGNAGQNLIVDFTSVTDFTWVQILGRVEEQAGHSLTVQLEITPFDDSAWHTYHTMKDQNANQNFENYSFFVADSSAYINSGTVKVRFIHEMGGNANDDWVFDVVALYQ